MGATRCECEGEPALGVSGVYVQLERAGDNSKSTLSLARAARSVHLDILEASHKSVASHDPGHDPLRGGGGGGG